MANYFWTQIQNTFINPFPSISNFSSPFVILYAGTYSHSCKYSKSVHILIITQNKKTER